MKRLGGVIANAFLVIASLAVTFGLAELGARGAFPQFADQIHTRNLTAGKYRHMGTVLGFHTRLPAEEAELVPQANDRVVLVIGDSVADGYGLSYFDIFWSIWQRRLELEGRREKVVALSGYGNNFSDNAQRIIDAIGAFEERGIPIASVIYQFNFNDLLPITRADLQQWNREQPFWQRFKRRSGWFNRLRHEVLNHSVFLRVASVKVAALVNQIGSEGKSCAELGLKALGAYSYVFVAKTQEQPGIRAWQQFEESLKAVLAELGPVPFAIVVSPISPLVHPGLNEHHLALPPRLDCGTVDPNKELDRLAATYQFSLCNPIAYMRNMFEKYRHEGNIKTMFHENDDNHPNETGQLLMAEYCYEHLFRRARILQQTRGPDP
jgi:hypothetical protein